jgi:hypothetical protein
MFTPRLSRPGAGGKMRTAPENQEKSEWTWIFLRRSILNATNVADLMETELGVAM